ncbi:MAG: hypothetical protein ACWA41_11765 [Putridiphycobacter sp.]
MGKDSENYLYETKMKYSLVEIFGYLFFFSLLIFLLIYSFFWGLVILIFFSYVFYNSPTKALFYEDKIVFIYLFFIKREVIYSDVKKVKIEEVNILSAPTINIYVSKKYSFAYGSRLNLKNIFNLLYRKKVKIIFDETLKYLFDVDLDLDKPFKESSNYEGRFL